MPSLLFTSILTITLSAIAPALAVDPGNNAVSTNTSYVVRLTNNENDYFCQGTLLAPNIIITAAHCLSERIGVGQFKVALRAHSYVDASTRISKAPPNMDTAAEQRNYLRTARTISNLSPEDIAIVHLNDPMQTQITNFPRLPTAEECTSLQSQTNIAVQWNVFLSDAQNSRVTLGQSAIRLLDRTYAIAGQLAQSSGGILSLVTGATRPVVGDSGSGLILAETNNQILLGVQTAAAPAAQNSRSFFVNLCNQRAWAAQAIATSL